MDSTQAFHAIINLFLIPLWLLSGSLFPLSGASLWIRLLMRINPLTYGTEALRSLLFPGSAATDLSLGGNLAVLAIVHAGDVRGVISCCEPSHHQAGGMMQLSPSFFPALDAVLNGSSAVLIGSGLYFIKRGRTAGAQARDARGVRHLDSVPDFYFTTTWCFTVDAFSGPGLSRALYFTILISHTILAAVVVPFILITLARALKGSFARHKKIAPYTWAIWMYVSVTGVVIYFMLYKVFVQ